VGFGAVEVVAIGMRAWVTTSCGQTDGFLESQRAQACLPACITSMSDHFLSPR
jgi:hypothetical protein